MPEKAKWAAVFVLTLVFASGAFAQGGLYLGVLGGYSAQKPKIKDVEFNTDTTFLYGLRGGVKFMMVAVEVNYFQAAHNLEPKEFLTFAWGEREVDYNFIGLNFKWIFPFFLINPYLTFGYGYYTADVHQIDKDTQGGYNLGLGLELNLGSRLSLLAEGKYHHVNLDIDEQELGLGDLTISGGLNIYF
ncbi:MAG: outer membrane beta-barrel protein [Candidatus Aminicenantes bacterium]